MKKLFLPAAFVAALLVTSCGPNAEELKRVQDSIDKAKSDSVQAAKDLEELANQARLDSIAQVEQAKADSIRVADSLANIAASKKGSKPNKPKEEPKKTDGSNDTGAKGRGGSGDQQNKTGASGRK